ncbi:hypothetical protein ACRALDRAFT_1061307 [Sodiomyces alcalophilus JCM 7366]|uniref:uncharacterized protein n=1 Tax=Sodiomyces alcalophilus JCM 7366 TaxID=591952 RepID=UPI0039B68667
MSGLVHKIKDAITSDKSSEPAGSHSSHGTHGAHDSRTGHTADPVGAGSSTLGTGSTTDNFGTSGTGITGAPGGSGTAGTTGTTGAYGSSNTRAGPHQSDMANKMDPRVDSDRDNRGAPGGMTGTTGTSGLGSSTRSGNTYGSSTTGGYGASGTTRSENTYGSGTTGTTGTMGTTGTTGTGGYGSSNTRAGPHQSDMANKMDPRVDSDRDNRAAPGASMGGNQFSSGATAGGLGSSHTRGTTGTTGTTAGYGASTNPGPAPNTAGPHKQDMLNKMDPRVDSDLDNSKTMGQDKTFSRPDVAANRDPLDAAQVPPSVMREYRGEPTIRHDDTSHDRARRNSSVSHQEMHRGL